MTQFCTNLIFAKQKTAPKYFLYKLCIHQDAFSYAVGSSHLKCSLTRGLSHSDWHIPRTVCVHQCMGIRVRTLGLAFLRQYCWAPAVGKGKRILHPAQEVTAQSDTLHLAIPQSKSHRHSWCSYAGRCAFPVENKTEIDAKSPCCGPQLQSWVIHKE